ncbi:MAG: DUF1080 domain-containing protein [Mucilaginibacter polytrichastri]|nr:DUF1080 domain-containing protein [Mucilaginibacter polytrichastri]
MAFAACTSSPKNTSENSLAKIDDSIRNDSADWTSLFDGNTTAGWHTYGKTTIGEAWKAEKGVLHLDASKKNDWQTAGGGDIVTDEEFDNFDLKLEWKISPAGNSGIMFYVAEDAAKYPYPWSTGPEMQVCDNALNEDGKIFKHHAADLYDLIASTPGAVKPAGEWNAAEIISNKGDLTFLMNGKRVLRTTLWDDAWKKRVAGSKFSTMPGFGTFKKGRISLQDHGADVWYRNIRIKKM